MIKILLLLQITSTLSQLSTLSNNNAACARSLTREDEIYESQLTGASSTSGHRLLSSSTSSNTTTTTSTSHAPHVHASAQEIGFFTLCIFVGVITRTWIEPKLFFSYIPYTVILILIGFMFGGLSIYTQNDDSVIGGFYNFHCHLSYNQTTPPNGCNVALGDCLCANWFDRFNVNILHDISPHVILYVFLPPLIFESAFFMDIHIFVRSFRGIVALAVLGVTVATVVTGLFLQYVASNFKGSCVDYSPLANFDTAMMMGAMLSATDPVAVVSILKSLGASPSLGTLIEGESLLNDGTAYAMFLIFQARSQYFEVSKHMPESVCMKGTLGYENVTSCDFGKIENVEGETIITTFILLIVVGPIIGYIVGILAVMIVEFVYNDVIIETTMTVLAAYTSWCVAEFCKSSGVLAVVVTGLCMSHGRGLAFTEKAKHFLHEFWEMIGYLLNTMVFIISGTIIGRKMADDANVVSRYDFTMGLILYLWVHVARAIALLVAQPFVNKRVCWGKCTGYDFDWRQSIVMWWGGLRGAVGLALGLIVAESPYWDKHQYIGIPEDRKAFFRDGVIFNIGFVAGMTLFVNGVTMGPLVRLLGLNKQSSEIAERNLQRIIDELDRRLRKKIHKLNSDGHTIRTEKKKKDITKIERREQRANDALKSALKQGNIQAGNISQRSDSLSTQKGKSTHNFMLKKQSSLDKKLGNSSKKNEEESDAHNVGSHAHLNHSEFEHVDWKSVYQYMPVESSSVYGRRVKKREIDSWWGRSGFMFCPNWNSRESGCRHCISVSINNIIHNWCGCFLLIPEDIKHALNVIFCCGKCGESKEEQRAGTNGCCTCCTPSYHLGVQKSKAEKHVVPARLQRRWAKYKTEYESILAKQAAESLDQGLDRSSSGLSRKMLKKTNSTSSNLSLSSKALRKSITKSKTTGSSNTNNGKRGSSGRKRRGSVLQKRGTFAEMADISLSNAKEKHSNLSSVSLNNRNGTEFKMEEGSTSSNDEFLQCKTYEERKNMLNTLLNLGKARAQYCRFVKEKYWHVYEEGLLDKLAFRDLADAEDAMLDMTDQYFITLNHHIAPILEKDEMIANIAWSTFKWEEFVISGELKSFNKSLQDLTNIPSSIIFLSGIRCCSWLVRRHLYFFVNRARDIAASFVHAHEEVIRHIEHNKLFPSEICEHIICEAEFQIMAAKNVLHNIDEVFPEIAAHLQTMTATRYLLRQEQQNIDSYLHAGEISGKEHEALMESVLKSLQKLVSHPKPDTMTPNFQSLLLENDRHKETFGRVIDNLPLNSQINLLMTLAQGAQMIYLRAGDLVYEQGVHHDHTGHKNRGIYYIARGAVTSVWVPGKIRKSRKAREDEYFKELHRIRKEMLQTLIRTKKLARRKSKMLADELYKIRTSNGLNGDTRSRTDTDLSNEYDDNDDDDGYNEDGTYMKRGTEFVSTGKETASIGKDEAVRNKMKKQSRQSTGLMSSMITHEMKKNLKQAILTILEQTTESQNTIGDTALNDLCTEIPGLDQIMGYFTVLNKNEKVENDQKDEDLIHSAEDDYVNAMLAPSTSFVDEMKSHGADLDGSGHISQHEVDIYRQVQLLSASNQKVDMLDIHLVNHMFGEYEVMNRINTRQHSVECQGVVIAFYIAPDHMLKLCQEYPPLEEEMWKRAAVTAAKLRLTETPHDYRHRFTRDLRIAFQNGRVSSPVLRRTNQINNVDTVLETDGSEVVQLNSENEHVFFLRTKYKPVGHHHLHVGPSHSYNCDGDKVIVGLKYSIQSGPNNTVRIQSDQVAIIYTLDVSKMKHGVGSPKNKHSRTTSQSGSSDTSSTGNDKKKEAKEETEEETRETKTSTKKAKKDTRYLSSSPSSSFFKQKEETSTTSQDTAATSQVAIELAPVVGK